jgi:hypothetical protein
VRLITCLFVLGACTGSSAIDAGMVDAPFDAPPDAPVSTPTDASIDASCAELRAAFTAAAASLDDSCAAATDCVVTGGAFGGAWCDCYQYLPQIAVNQAAYASSDVEASARRFFLQCWGQTSCSADNPCVCDVPPARRSCSDAGRCVAEEPPCGCFPELCADAGPDAP